jgi:deoxyribodipyrimidine photo-lyase
MHIRKKPGSAADHESGEALMWFRRDLRNFDQAALCASLEAHDAVHCVFVFDTEILDALATRADRRVTFIWDSVRELKSALEAQGGGLRVLRGRARDEIPRLARDLGVAAVYANRDYEPDAVARDDEVGARLRKMGIDFRTFKDQVIFELDEVRTASGGPFSVFTPYKRAWLRILEPRDLAVCKIGSSAARLAPAPSSVMPSLDDLGFDRVPLPVSPGMSGGARLWKAFRRRIDDYAAKRDRPALAGTSRLSAHLRFGTISIRELVRYAYGRNGAGPATWLSELIWRDFYFAVLSARPDVVNHAFHREYDRLRWNHSGTAWLAWCEGRTGYPLVDAAMRELKANGSMHNRLRMVTATFLIKDLGMDWRRGERYFARELLDYDLAANNGGWQWCASTGGAAQPWFRIFNPVTQSRRFDPEGTYIRRWLPELKTVPRKYMHAPWEMDAQQQKVARCFIGHDYPAPIVRHDDARRRTLARYRAAKKG